MEILKTLGIEPVNPSTSNGANSWAETRDMGLIASINPANGRAIAEVFNAAETDYQRLIAASQKAFSHWRMVPAPKRGELVRLIGEKLRQKKDALGSLVSMETGKLKEEGDGEVQEMIDMADLCLGQSRMLYGKTMHSERPRHRMYEQWHPLGPMGVITAFNFPVAVWAWNAFIGAICGNTVIWKPSPKSPLCAVGVQKICNEAMDELGYSAIFQTYLPSENRLIEAMASDQRIPLISFTGSTAIGRKIHGLVAQRLGKSILELSGNNAVIVDETAELDLALTAIVFGAIGTTGQRCTTTRRVICHKKIMEPLTKRLTQAFSSVKIGDPLDSSVRMGPLVDQASVWDFEKTMAEIRASSAKLLYGGKVLKREGYFVEPTLILASNKDAFVQKETFAPILYLIEFEEIQDAIQINNASSHGLSSSLFTRNLQNQELFLSAMGSDCGIANVNIGTSGAEIGGAFGGEKDTGGGRESGSDAWKAYMRRQTNTINWGDDLPLAQGISFGLSD